MAVTHPEIAKEWHTLNNTSLTPLSIGAGSGKAVWWICSNNSQHEWIATCNDRSGKKSGCPLCVDYLNSRAVCRIMAWLYANKLNFVREKTFSDLKAYKSRKKLRFDFFLPGLNILIEYDGQQHFKPVDCWGGDEAFKALILNDHQKNLWALDNGFMLIRISFSDEDEIEKIRNYQPTLVKI